MKERYKPGHGWHHLSGPVWEHVGGARIHLIGLIRLPDMSFITLNKYPECMDGYKMININGGNRKRGLMSWVKYLIEEPND